MSIGPPMPTAPQPPHPEPPPPPPLPPPPPPPNAEAPKQDDKAKEAADPSEATSPLSPNVCLPNEETPLLQPQPRPGDCRR
jgi:hypothetical protein